MHRAGAAEGIHRHAPRIFAALAQMSARRVGHVFVDDLVNPPSDLLDGHVQFRAQATERLARAVEIQLHLAAEKIIRIEITEHQISVRDSRLGAALSITHRSRIGARAIRPDFEKAERVDPRDAAAAGAELDHVDDRNTHR